MCLRTCVSADNAEILINKQIKNITNSANCKLTNTQTNHGTSSGVHDIHSLFYENTEEIFNAYAQTAIFFTFLNILSRMHERFQNISTFFSFSKQVEELIL